MGKLRILNEAGDREVPWTADDVESLRIAEESFFEHQRQGSAAFAKTGSGHELIKSFVPDAEEILIVKPLVGG